MVRYAAFGLLCAVVILTPPSAAAQDIESRYSASWTNAHLEKALPELVRLTGIDLIYDEDTVRNRVGHCVARQVTAEEMLRCVVQSAGLDFVRTSDGTYVIIPPAARTPPSSRLWGRVVDASTGKPLAFANILLADSRTGVAAGQNGEFVVASLLPGPHRVVVTYVGYETATLVDLELRPGESRRVEIELEPTSIVSELIVVDGLQQRLSSRLVEHELGPVDMASAGGETRDVMRAATTIQGVSSYRSLADLHLQGGATGEHITLLDGTPVRDPVSFGRYLGAFSPLAIGSMTVHKSGFSARQGSHLAGVLALQQDIDTPGAAIHIDPVSVNARLAGDFPFPSGRRLTAMLAARSSIWSRYQAPDMADLLRDWTRIDPFLASIWRGTTDEIMDYQVVEFEPHVAFSDLHAALRLTSEANGTLTASFFRAGNRIDSEVTAREVDAPGTQLMIGDDYDWTNWAANARYQWLIGNRTFAALRIAASEHSSGYGYDATYVGDSYRASDPYAVDARSGVHQRVSHERHDIREWTAGLEAVRVLVPRHSIDVGLSAHLTDASIRAANPFITSLEFEETSWHLAGYATSTYSPNLSTTLEAGTRATYQPSRQTLYAEPRISARFDAGSYAVRLSGGLYRQFVNQFELTSPGASSAIPTMLFWLPSERTMAPPRALHTALDMIVAPPGPLTVQLESYYKNLSRLLALDYEAITRRRDIADNHVDRTALSEIIEAGRGYAAGAGIRLQYATSPVDATVSYSFSRSRRSFDSRFGGEMESVPWEEPHRLTIAGRTRIWPDVEFRAVWTTARGRTWALRRAYYDYLPHLGGSIPATQQDLRTPGDQALPPHEQLDIALAFGRSTGWARLDAQLSLLNVFDHRNVFDRGFSIDGIPATARHFPGRRPAFTVTVRR